MSFLLDTQGGPDGPRSATSAYHRASRPLRPVALAVLIAVALLGLVAEAGAASRYGSAWALRSAGVPKTVSPVPQGPVVAVVDSGVDLGHPALADALWQNPGEVVNGLDDDGNGFVDDVHGVNLVEPGAPVDDRSGHGTAVAGILAAKPRWKRRSGVAPHARIMAVKVLGDHMDGTTADVARGMRYALQEGAQIINVSLTTPDDDPAIERVLREAGARGVLVVAAAGNSGADLGSDKLFPAAYHLPTMLTVGATDRYGSLIEASAYGDLVDLAAPGLSVPSIRPRARVRSFTGTSAATPFVAGGAALLWARRPNATLAQVRRALLRGGRRGADLRDQVRFGGLDVRRAMRSLDRTLRASARAR
ncbi:S8 family peptidase [Paraconexibacter sp.]|uniref:S8 family peptidase n=1 Tax=Paraconexibacter sp. TaxID=2949640 RepID=UPI003568E3F9